MGRNVKVLPKQPAPQANGHGGTIKAHNAFPHGLEIEILLPQEIPINSWRRTIILATITFENIGF